MKKVLSVLIVLVVLVGVAGYGLYHDYNKYLNSPVALSDKTIINIKKGMSFNGLIGELKEKNVPINELYLKLYARHSGLGRQIKAGEYRIEQQTTPIQMMAILTSGRSITYNFTIVEGSNYKQLLASIAANKYIENDVKGLSLEQLLKKVDAKHEHPEGLFLAETYNFEKNSTASALLERAHKMLLKQLDQQWQARNTTLPYKSAYEALIMASIVEKETARADERPVIAGVFVRRLNKRMRLQTDPTVIYGMGDAYQGNIRRSDLRKPTPYNTYTIPALPPTPIAMVGPDAIIAALNPANGKSLYFVAKGDGSHYFSASLREHNNAVRKYQLSRRKDYRSSP